MALKDAAEPKARNPARIGTSRTSRAIRIPVMPTPMTATLLTRKCRQAGLRLLWKQKQQQSEASISTPQTPSPTFRWMLPAAEHLRGRRQHPTAAAGMAVPCGGDAVTTPPARAQAPTPRTSPLPRKQRNRTISGQMDCAFRKTPTVLRLTKENLEHWSEPAPRTRFPRMGGPDCAFEDGPGGWLLRSKQERQAGGMGARQHRKIPAPDVL